MEEEELIIKGFTDCVYFLASPLTCKKGIECEYRHSEVARLNPRDCWYWLGGCCYNPECAFRHPPLDGLKEAYHEPRNLNDGPVGKTNVPCRFYLKGYCSKGDNCSFLHGPAESAQIEHTHPVEKLTQDFRQWASIVPEKHEPVKSKEIVEDDGFVQSEENIENEEFVQSESDVFDDQSSDGYVEREGFDVLVEGGSERLGYEKDADYYPVYDEEQRVVDVENARKKQRCDVYDGFDKVSEQPRESIFYRLSFQKRNLKPEPIYKLRKGSDLREYLKRRVVDGSFFRGYDSDHRSRGNFKRHGPRVGIDFELVHMNKHRQTIRDKRLMKPLVLRKPAYYSNRRSRDESGVFTGPKSLDQIKEEKKKALQESFNVTESDGFRGPRPLSEILKNKRKLVST